MMDPTPADAFIRSVAVGVIVSAPVGPVGVYCINRAFRHGWITGMLAGLGAATIDTIFGLIASIGVAQIEEFLTHHAKPLNIGFAIVLLAVGVFYLMRPALAKEPNVKCEKPGLVCFTTLGLTMANPGAILALMLILFKLHITGHGPVGHVAVATGIFVGAMCWWTLLALGVQRVKSWLPPSADVVWLNRITGTLLLCWGVGLGVMQCFPQLPLFR